MLHLSTLLVGFSAWLVVAIAGGILLGAVIGRRDVGEYEDLPMMEHQQRRAA